MSFVTIQSRAINLSAKLRFPSIKFRYGLAREQHQQPEVTASTSAASTSQSKVTQSSEPIYDFQLPSRFQRKPLSDEEVDFINRGGPA